jgi:hypothetical protein
MDGDEITLTEEEIHYARDHHIDIRGNFRRRVLRLHMNMRAEPREVHGDEPDPTTGMKERLALLQVRLTRRD